MRIPRIFHQIWVGPDPLPDEFTAYRETWRDHHPDWDLRLWTEENLPDDLELLDRHGGVYVDLDFECLRPIEPLIGGAEFFLGYRKQRRVNNAIVGSVPGHPLLAQAIREIRPRTTYGPVDKAGTGPLFWRKLVRDRPEVTIFPPEVFYPRTLGEQRTAYAVHHRTRSWQDAKTLQKRLVGAERLLAETRAELEEWQERCRQAESELDSTRSRPR